ncbi:hypothetical protein [Pseudoduganella sp.]|uniref:hypothetical protein n=1 Tax=Pseudoduganella sp. TaxID=1880898 RepID=UPI0035B42CCF
MIRKLRTFLPLLGGILALSIAAAMLSRWLDAPYRTTLLGMMLAAYALLHVWRLFQPDLRSERKKTNDRVTRTGQLLVNGPVAALLVGPVLVMQAFFAVEPPLPQFAALGAGFVLAWCWWSLAVHRWRIWARAKGMSAAEVQRYGEAARLLWPRGHFFERTEWERWTMQTSPMKAFGIATLAALAWFTGVVLLLGGAEPSPAAHIAVVALPFILCGALQYLLSRTAQLTRLRRGIQVIVAALLAPTIATSVLWFVMVFVFGRAE